jgi:hypothetical protein
MYLCLTKELGYLELIVIFSSRIVFERRKSKNATLW